MEVKDSVVKNGWVRKSYKFYKMSPVKLGGFICLKNQVKEVTAEGHPQQEG